MTFKPVNGYEGYSINESGLVKNKQGKIMKTRKDKYGYERLNLQKEGKKVTEKIHRLVMTTFNPVENANNMTVDHIDGNPSNNNISNLRWVYLGENLNLKQMRDADEASYFLKELMEEYSKEEIAEILKLALQLGKALKSKNQKDKGRDQK